MNTWMRKIRGAFGMGLAWGATWFLAGMALLLAGARADVPFPLGFGLLGFLAGLTFSGILMVTEGHRRFDQMSLPRFAAWGAVGGLLFAGAFTLVAGLGTGVLVILGPVFALSGAGCAAGTLALARRGDDRTLLEAGAEADRVGLTPEEKRDLLGGGG